MGFPGNVRGAAPNGGDHQRPVPRPFALVDGRAVALWSLAGGTVSIRPLELLRPSVVEALRREAGSVLDFLRLPPKPVAFM